MYVYIYICMYMCVYVCMCVRMYVDVVDIDGTFMHMCTRVRRYMGFTYAFLFGECVCVCVCNDRVLLSIIVTYALRPMAVLWQHMSHHESWDSSCCFRVFALSNVGCILRGRRRHHHRQPVRLQTAWRMMLTS